MCARNICFVAAGFRTKRRWRFAAYILLLLGFGLSAFATLQARTWNDTAPFGLHGDRVQRDKFQGPERLEEVKSTAASSNVLESIALRMDHVMSQCKQWSMIAFRPLVTHWMVSRKHQFFYCPVEKTASTFWRRFIHQLEYTSPMKSPFEVDVQSVYASRDKNLEVTETAKDLKMLWMNTTKLLFVRDPYSRLFSAYVDKLLSPNPIFWNKWGKAAILKYRNITSESEGSIKCGDDVTFPEFIQLSVSQEGQGDTHVMSINRLCTPCQVNYTVIGKMETFARDTRHLLSMLHLNESQLRLEQMADDVIQDALVDSVKDAMSPSWLRETLRCITKADVVRRIWRKLQVRGFISWRFNYDIDPQMVTTLDGVSLIEVLKQVVKASTNRTELSIQKKQAMAEAFGSLNASQIAAIKRMFFLDFQMFNYEDSPPQAVDNRRGVVITTDAFDWRKDWDLSLVLYPDPS